MADSFEFQRVRDALGVTLLDVERGGKPEARLNIGAPAVEVIVLAVSLVAAREITIKPDHVALSGFNPDAAKKAAAGVFADRGYIEYGGRNIAQKFIANEAEGIMLPV